MTIRIPDGNAFRIRLTARNLITGEYTEAADLSNIDNLVINYVRRGIRFPHAYTIDEEGRATVADAGTLDCGFYGIELTGYYGGEKFRFYGKDLFEITTDTTDVIDPSNLIDIEITVKLNASGVSKDYVDHAVNGMEASMETMQADLRDEIAEAGKVDDVKVNGVSVVSGKKAIITVPTKVSDLTNDSGYQNEQQVQQKVDAAKITSADISVDGGTGTPSGSAGVSGNQLVIALHNIKGEKGDPGESIVGPQGPQGATSVYDQTTQDFLTTLETTTGQSQTTTMTQKAITDAIDSAKDTMGEMVEFEQWTELPQNDFVNGDVIAKSSSTSTQYCWFVKVNTGDKVTITATNASSAGFRVAFTDVVPAVGVTVIGKTDIGGTSVNATIVSPINGYMVLNHGSNVFADRVVKILRKGNYTGLEGKAPLKTLMDVVDMAGYNLVNVESTQVHGYSINKNGRLVTKASSSYRTWEFPVQEEKLYHIHGRVVGKGDYVGYAFYDSQFVTLAHGEIPNGELRSFDTVIISPKGAAYLRISGNTTDNGMLAELVSTRGNKTIYPKMTRDFINLNGGIGHGTATEIDVRCIVSTARYVKVKGNITMTTENDRYVRLAKYSSNYQLLGSVSEFDVEGGVETVLDVGNAAYIKIMLCNESGAQTPIPMEQISLQGDFGDDWDVFNVRSTDDGYQRIAVAVDVTDPNSCDQETDDVQDSGTTERDYGVIVLPERYNNVGEPTRLIIYCHGAAVNYGWSNTRFNTQDLEPQYWLAEGYAVMDVEGNPYDNSNEHFFIPQAMECYVAAYKWAIDHYNLRRDGVLVGGRSMGGGMALNLLRNECPIPVIAACPNVPCSTPTFYWNYMDNVRRAFCAEHYGLTNQPDSWTSASPMPSDEWECLKDNFDKIAKYSPLWALITDLPSKDILMSDEMNINKTSNYNEDEDGLYSTLHAKVKAPVKIFGVKDDTTCRYRRTSVLIYNVLLNGGNIVELRLFEEGDHHADTQNSNMRTTVTTRFGEELTDIPVVYVEMLRFWRRFEQE